MNEDKVMQIIINLKKFNSDLMDLNIKYAEELEKAKDKINEAIKYIERIELPEGHKWMLLEILKDE